MGLGSLINGSDYSQAQSEDDDNGSDDVAVPIEAPDGYMEEFFNEVSMSSIFACAYQSHV